MPEFVTVLVTVPNREVGNNIATALLDARLAACVNRVGPIHSRYWWQGAQEEAEEFLLIIKSLATHVPALTTLVKSNHTYSVPEVIALPILQGNPDYLQWIREETIRPKV